MKKFQQEKEAITVPRDKKSRKSPSSQENTKRQFEIIDEASMKDFRTKMVNFSSIIKV
jgi:hypothetical protein